MLDFIQVARDLFSQQLDETGHSPVHEIAKLLDSQVNNIILTSKQKWWNFDLKFLEDFHLTVVFQKDD